MRSRFLTVLVLACVLVGGAATAGHASSGWIQYKGTWIQYHYRLHAPSENPRVIALFDSRAKSRAIRHAKAHRDQHLADLAKLLRQSHQILTTAQAIIGQGIWGCIALHEEGGHNSSAGYFGMIYSPASYPEPGPTYARRYGNSWWNIPYSAQLQIAMALQRSMGNWSAWTTAPGCGA